MSPEKTYIKAKSRRAGFLLPTVMPDSNYQNRRPEWFGIDSLGVAWQYRTNLFLFDTRHHYIIRDDPVFTERPKRKQKNKNPKELIPL